MMKYSFSELVLMHEISGKSYLEIIDAKLANKAGCAIGNSNSISNLCLTQEQADAIEEWFTGIQDKCRNADLAIRTFYSRYSPLDAIQIELQKGANAIKAEFQPVNFIFSVNGKKQFEFLARHWKAKKSSVVEMQLASLVHERQS